MFHLLSLDVLLLNHELHVFGILLLLLRHLLLEPLHLRARILITPLLFAAPLLSGSLSGCLRLSLQIGHLLLLLRLLQLPLLLETPCLLLSVRGVRLLISCYLLHHRRLCQLLLLHHLR